MRVADIWPSITWPGGDSSTLLRELDSLSPQEWDELIGTLGDLSTAFQEAEYRATEQWATRFPREQATA